MSPAPLRRLRRALPSRAPEDVAGPWTAQAVQVLVTLGAAHRVVVDRGETYPAWEWDYRSPGFRLHVLGYLEVHDNRWRYVLELTEDPDEDEEFGRLMVQTVTLAGEADLMHREAAAMLNYACSLVETRAPA